MGGFVLFWHKGLGFCPRGVLSQRGFVLEGFCPEGFCPRGFCPRGVLSYTRVLHTILAYSINIGAQRDTCQTGVGRKHFCAVRHKNGKRAKVKRAKLASRQSETRRTGAASK